MAEALWPRRAFLFAPGADVKDGVGMRRVYPSERVLTLAVIGAGSGEKRAQAGLLPEEKLVLMGPADCPMGPGDCLRPVDAPGVLYRVTLVRRYPRHTEAEAVRAVPDRGGMPCDG